MKERLAHRWLTQLSMWALAVEAAKEFAKSPQQLQGYIRAQKLFLTGWPGEDPTSRFLHKKAILKTINARFKAHGYDYQLIDVRLKK